MGKVKKKQKQKRNRLGYFLRNFTKKHRISVRDQHTDTEVSYIYISSLRMVLASLGILLVLFAVVIAAVVYTPVLDNLPGNPGKKSREVLMQNIMKLDSLQHELTLMLQYSENMALVMEGKTPLVRSISSGGDEVDGGRDVVPRSLADSVLRGQIETPGGRYSLTTEEEIAAGAQNGGPRSMTFMIPVWGEVTVPFNPASRMYGVGINLKESQQVVAAADGTVVSSMWIPDDD